MSSKPAALVFDLGGVLADWNGIDPLIRLSGGKLDREAAREFWIHSPWVARLDQGECEPLAFAAAMSDALQLDIPAEAMRDQLENWLAGAYPGAPELLAALKGRFRLAALSNNNALHWGKIEREFDLLQRFDALFASHLLRLRKPDAAIYRHVEQALNLPGNQIAFFDDNIECVDAARERGWQAFHTIGFEQLQATLRRQGWL
ncbi:HAD family hydrolase [Chromobacterium sp. IIBBL 290-4]|uniref:HAD family hydrolase n=1 Tax=Chromobacterium sp. IIBBL 290-4 TaxID=2953890 RepID=UPI0020B71D00|nr:HAD family phosphatase [Chromobacterium sp. IIBBL 290-4]UTH74510.1 HAD family phosphatase [Chromobacterium sp. IIBBL 290-4]